MRDGRGSHSPTLLTLVERELRSAELVTRGDVVLVAVSGGPDSQALLHVMGRLRAKLGHELRACGVDHGLRREAEAELGLAQGLAASLGIEFRKVRLAVGAGANLMARAREARYGALQEMAQSTGANRIAVGHQADDRAETVVMGLLRGAGPGGLAVFSRKSGNLIRPMIRARRSDVFRHLARHGIEFAQDPTNADRRYLRSAVRWEVLPCLERFSPRIVEHLCQLADDLGEGGAVSVPRGLGRAHLLGIVQALSSGQASVRVALPGNRVLRVDSATGALVVDPCLPAKLQRTDVPDDDPNGP